MQENPLSVFFKKQKFLMKFFLICEIFFDLFNKCAKKIMKSFAWFKNYCKVFNMLAKNGLIFLPSF